MNDGDLDDGLEADRRSDNLDTPNRPMPETTDGRGEEPDLDKKKGKISTSPDAAAAWERLQRKMSGSPPTISDDGLARLKDLASRVRTEDARREGLRSIFYAVMRRSNANALSSKKIASIFKMKAWPSQLPVVSDDTVYGFANARSTSPDPMIMASYLYALSQIHDADHPCFKDYVVTAIMGSADTFFDFQANLVGDTEGRAGLESLARLKFFGTSLHRFFAPSGSSTLTALLDTPLFKQLKPAASDDDIDGFSVCALRFGISGRYYVASTLKFTLIQGDKDDAPLLFVRSYHGEASDKETLRSQGFVVPRLAEVYFVQYHVLGEGFNISAIPLAAFQSPDDPHYFKGLVLALDRAGKDGPLASRLVLYNDYSRLSRLWGEIDKNLIVSKLGVGKDTALAREVANYLRDDGFKVVKPLNMDSKVNFGPMTSWKLLAEYINHEEVSKWIDGAEELKVEGYSETALKI